MTPLKTLAVPRVMISVGTVSLEVKMPLKAPRIAPRAAAIRKGTMIEPVPPVVDEHPRGHVDREGGQRREGHVDPAGDQDEVRGDGEESGDHHGARQVDQVVRGVELSGAGLDDEGEREDDQEDPEFVGAQDFREESGH